MAANEVLKERARLLRQEGLSFSAISNRLQVPRTTVRSWLRDVPHPQSKAAREARQEAQAQAPLAPAEPEDEAGNGAGRAREHVPIAPSEAPRLPPPPVPGASTIDYSQIRGYIEGVYIFSGKLATERGDAVLGMVITDHAGQAATAWEHWIQSEPRVQQWLERLMVGTPLGEVIFVHASLVFSYTLARAAAADMARRAAAAEQPSEEHEPASE